MHGRVSVYIILIKILIKIAVFWVVAPFSLVEVRPDDGGSKDL
jgi:hypothetical protein